MTKKGDTLIEVTIAVGIFSMIAIAIASVMSSGSSGAQTSLETTLAREEIDAQAEALRFIHSTYIASRNTTDSNNSNNYAKDIWNTIVNNAIAPPGSNDDESFTLKFTPDNCDALYSGDQSIYAQNAFIINPKKLGKDQSGDGTYIPASTNDNHFFSASTYPRLIFTDNGDEALIDNNNNTLYRAEGIYVIAVKESGTTTQFSTDNQSAFYDFYIRTCWYGNDASRPSTISTVIRLYNPDVRPATNS